MHTLVHTLTAMPPFICSINWAINKAVTQTGEVDAAVGAWTPVHVGQALKLVHHITCNVAMEIEKQGVQVQEVLIGDEGASLC